MRVRRMLAVIVMVAASGVGAGCSEKSEADAEPRSSDSAGTSSATPGESAATAEPAGPVEPTPPPEMENFDEAGAKAFAEFYWEVVTYAQATGDTALLKSISLPRCAVCRGGLKWIEKLHASGHRVVDNLIAASAGQASAIGNLGSSEIVGYEVTTRIETEGGRVLDETGELVEEQTPDAMRLVLFVHFRDQHGWALSDWTRA